MMMFGGSNKKAPLFGGALYAVLIFSSYNAAIHAPPVYVPSPDYIPESFVFVNLFVT
jgi:hypothetical protein